MNRLALGVKPFKDLKHFKLRKGKYKSLNIMVKQFI